MHYDVLNRRYYLQRHQTLVTLTQIQLEIGGGGREGVSILVLERDRVRRPILRYDGQRQLDPTEAKVGDGER